MDRGEVKIEENEPVTPVDKINNCPIQIERESKLSKWGPIEIRGINLINQPRENIIERQENPVAFYLLEMTNA